MVGTTRRAVRRVCKISIGLVLLGLLAPQPAPAFPKIPEADGARNLEEFGKTFSNREEWQARARNAQRCVGVPEAWWNSPRHLGTHLGKIESL